MATSLRELIVSVSADTTVYQREMQRASRMGGQYFKTVQDGGRSATQSWNTQTSAARSHATALQASTQAITRYAAAAATAFGVGQLAQLADSWTNISNRLRLVTDSTESFAQAHEDVLRIAQATRQPLDATAELYQRIAMNQNELQLSGQDMARVVETISKSMVISGTSAQGAQAALVQLGQAFASGTLRGEELNSVLEQAPALAQAIAAGMGVPIGQLRELGKAGELTARQVIDALQRQASAVDDAFGSMDITIGQSMTNLRTAVQIFVGGASDVSGASTAIAESLAVVARHFDTIATVGGAAAMGALAGRMMQLAQAAGSAVVGMVQSRAAAIAETVAIRDATLASQLKAQADVRRARLAMDAARGTASSALASRNLATALLTERQATIAATQAQVAYDAALSRSAAAKRIALGLLGGPAGLALTVGTVAAGWLLFRDNSNEATRALREMTGPLDEVVGKFQELGSAQQALALREAEQAVEQATRSMEASVLRLQSNVSDPWLKPVFEAIDEDVRNGVLTVEEGSRKMSEAVQRFVRTGYTTQGLRDRLIELAAEWETNALASQTAQERLDAMSGSQEQAAAVIPRTTSAIDDQADAWTQVAERAESAGNRIRGALQSLPGQIARMGKSPGEVARMDVADWLSDMNMSGTTTLPEYEEAQRQGEQYIALVERQAAAQEALSQSTRTTRAQQAAQASESDQWLARINEQYGDLLANQEREIALYGEIGRSAVMAYDLAHGSLSNLAEAQKQVLQQGAEWLDFLDETRAIEGVWDSVREEHANKQVERFNEMEQFGIQAARNIQSELGQGLYDVLGGQFDGIADRFSDMLRRMTAELVASQLLNALGQWAQGYTGAGAGFVNAFGNAMGGGRAMGGATWAGGINEVAEGGRPELFQSGGKTYLISNQPGLVSPLMGATGGGGGGMSNLRIEIVNNGPPSQVESASMTQQPDGTQLLRMTLGAVAESIASGTGPINPALRGRFGLRDAV